MYTHDELTVMIQKVLGAVKSCELAGIEPETISYDYTGTSFSLVVGGSASLKIPITDSLHQEDYGAFSAVYMTALLMASEGKLSSEIVDTYRTRYWGDGLITQLTAHKRVA